VYPDRSQPTHLKHNLVTNAPKAILKNFQTVGLKITGLSGWGKQGEKQDYIGLTHHDCKTEIKTVTSSLNLLRLVPLCES
jgi:hypothetical protein